MADDHPIVRPAALTRGVAARPRDVFAAAGKLQRGCFQRGEALFQHGDPALPLHLIRSGRVKVACVSAAGAEQVVALLGAGDCVGEIGAPAGRGQATRVTALEPTETLVVLRADLLALAVDNPSYLHALSELLAHRLLRAAAYGVLAICRHQFVRSTGDGAGAEGHGGPTVELPPPITEAASP